MSARRVPLALLSLCVVVSFLTVSFAAERATLTKSGDWRARAAALGGVILEDYGSFVLVELPEGADVAKAQGWSTLPEAGRVVLEKRRFDPLVDGYPRDLPTLPKRRTTAASSNELVIVQFHGPIKDSWLVALEASGARRVGFLPTFNYVFEIESGASESLREAPLPLGPASRQPIVWVGPYLPELRVDEALLERTGMVSVVATLLDTEAGQALARRLELRGRLIEPVADLEGFLRVVLQIDARKLPELAQEPALFRLDERRPLRAFGEVGALNNAGFRVNGTEPGFGEAGMGYIAWLGSRGFDLSTPWDFAVNVTDSGLDIGNSGALHHQDLDGPGAAGTRVAYVKDWTTEEGTNLDGHDSSGHGTACAGVIAGHNDADGTANGEVSTHGYHFGLGVAPAVRVGSSKMFRADGGGELTGTFTDLERYGYARGARLSSNSWGFGSGNEYDSYAREFDMLVRDVSDEPGEQPLIVLFAAGNDGPGAHTVRPPSTAKNVITLGAAENWWPGYSSCGHVPAKQDTPGDDVVDYSGRGPTADGRLKPDLVAIAQGWITIRGPQATTGCGIGYDGASTSLYGNFNGTSAATPTAAGAAALLYDYGRREWGAPPSPALVKAALVATARDLEGGVDGRNGDGTGVEMAPAPNTTQGWGLIDMGRMLGDTAQYHLDQFEIFDNTGDQYETRATIDTDSEAVRVVLAWTDAPGTVGGAAWVNDLDLEVVHAGQLYRGNVFENGRSVTGGAADDKNNLEVVHLPAGTTGEIEIRIRAAQIAGDGVPSVGDATDQDFALFVQNATGCTPPAAPPTLTAEADGRNAVRLSWGAVDGAAGYRVYRGLQSGGALEELATLGGGVTTYRDTRAPGGIALRYAVRADSGCLSPASPLASATTIGYCTQGPSFTGIGRARSDGAESCGVSITWPEATARCAGSLVYDVYRSGSESFTPSSATRIAAGVVGSSFNDVAALESGRSYYYAVRARHNDGGPDDGNTKRVAGHAAGGPVGDPVDHRYTGGMTAIPNNDAAGIDVELPLTNAGWVGDLLTYVGVSHDRPTDLVVELHSPDGASVRLHDRGSGSITGLYRTYDVPDAVSGPGSMSDFDGGPADGTWRLHIADELGGPAGQLVVWRLKVTGEGSCNTAPSIQAGEAAAGASLRVGSGAGSALELAFSVPAETDDVTVYLGRSREPLDALHWDQAFCNLGTTSPVTVDPGTPQAGELFYFLPVARRGGNEGSYGRSSGNSERWPSSGLSCDATQTLQPAP